MASSRREFLARTAALIGTATAARAQADDAAASDAGSPAAGLPPGSPPAFGTSPAVGPVVTAATFAEAEKLVQIELTQAEREQAAGNWRESLAALAERRTGPKKVKIEDA